MPAADRPAPPAPAPAPETLQRLARLWVILGLVLHGLVGAGSGLSVDEAHYLLYALRPALSYFDHPPLVGWVQWPLVALDAPVAVLRLLPGLLWLLASALVWQLASDLDPEPARRPLSGLLALLCFGLAPVFHVLGIGLLPDSLLLVLSLALLRQTRRLMRTASSPGTDWVGWVGLGLLLGLAGLAKYTAILVVPALVLCLLRSPGPALLRRSGPWLAVAIALLCVAPVLVWNAHHHWLSFSYQLNHGAGSGWTVGSLLRFLLLQLLAYGPLLAWAVAGWRHSSGADRWLVAYHALPFLVLALLAGGGSSLPHWTAPAWAVLCPWAGIGLAAGLQRGRHRLALGLALLQAVVVAALLAMMVGGLTPGSGRSAEAQARANPFADLHGWDQAGRRARRLAQEHGLEQLAVSHWTLASRLGWYARPLPVQVLDDRIDQFDLWAPPLLPGADLLWLDWSLMPYAPPAGPGGFARCERLDTVPIHRLGLPLSEFRLYACRNWQGPARPDGPRP